MLSENRKWSQHLIKEGFCWDAVLPHGVSIPKTSHLFQQLSTGSLKQHGQLFLIVDCEVVCEINIEHIPLILHSVSCIFCV